MTGIPGIVAIGVRGDSAPSKAETYGDDVAMLDAKLADSDEVEGVWMHELGHNVMGYDHFVCNQDPRGNADDANPDASHIDDEDSPALRRRTREE